MKENKLKKIYGGLCLCSVFRSVWDSPLLRAYEAYCLCEDGKTFEKYKAYAAFVAEIYRQGGSLTELVKRLVFEDENVYIKGVANGKALPAALKDSAKSELRCFAAFGALTRADFAADMGTDEESLPDFSSVNADVVGAYQERLQNLHRHGYGIFSSHCMFRFSDDKKIEPIVSADKTGMAQFIGYETQRESVVANTRAFLEGRPAANALLCGDAGTGKSSTVKAIANEFFNEGLRLIELRKDQLRYLPTVMAHINGNPLKFIIFIDDLSFNQNNDDFSMLKAALEGSASATADNAVIYATSNRRHIVKESFGDREGDDVHRNDTLQETLSLSERFGLTVLFSKPDKALYLKIVRELAKRNSLNIPDAELAIKAEAFALKKGSRSARAAEQFIHSLL
ncbi:MAG: ATP-binding protein [Clostridiales bacterium]|nr:ATP-binding protein [Clostridiales bacterium]